MITQYFTMLHIGRQVFGKTAHRFLVICLFLIIQIITTNAQAEGILRLGIDAADLGTSDPHKAASRNDRIVVDMLFNGLVRYTPGRAPEIEPDLAAEIPTPRFENGFQVWRIRLREDVICQAGPKTEAYRLTADDVVFSLNRAADPERSSYAGTYEGMSFRKVSEFEIDIALEKPLSSILFYPKIADYAGGFVVCKMPAETVGDQRLVSSPIGTGPFQLGLRKLGHSLELDANPRYFRGRPNLDGVEIRYLPKLEDRDSLLRSGDLDVIFGSERQDWHDDINSLVAVNVDVFGVGQVITVHFNFSKTPLDNPSVRRALILSLDRDEFKAEFADGVVENVYSVVPDKFLPGGLSKEGANKLGVGYGRNLTEARLLMAQAGYENGFALNLLSSERPHYLVNYQSLKKQLAQIGVRIELEVVPHHEMHKRIRNDENAIVIYVAWRPNADVFLTRFFHSKSTVLTGRTPDTNFSHYAGIDDLVEQARLARKPEDQMRFWRQAQIKLLHEAAAFPLHYINLVYARRDYVDYGHDLKASMALYPQFNEQTSIGN